MTLRAALLAWLLAALLPVAADAQERAALQLVLLDPLPAGAHARIAGQTADLAWRLTRAPATPGAALLERASVAAEERDARAALWIEESEGAFELRLLDARRQRLLERRFEIERGTDGLARSAALEALALAVRSALRALEADQEVGEAVQAGGAGAGTGTGTGVGTGTGTGAGTGTATGAGTREGEKARERGREREREREREAEARRDADADADERADEQAAAEEEAREAEQEAREAEQEAREEALDAGKRGAFDQDAVGLVVAAGWDLAVDGRSPHGQHAPWVRAGVSFGRVELGLRVEAALPAVLENDEAEVELARRLALAYVGVDVMRAEPFRLAAALAAGAASFRRETRDVAPGFERTDPEDTPAFAAGLELRAAYTLAEGAGARFSIELAAGALLVPEAPVLRFDTARQPRDEPLWWLQPELRLGPHLRVRL
jgi:hypothetical protein